MNTLTSAFTYSTVTYIHISVVEHYMFILLLHKLSLYYVLKDKVLLLSLKNGKKSDMNLTLIY